MNPIVLEMSDRVEFQRFKCMFVATRCGYRYQYAFDDETVANAMRLQWGNVPPVFYIPRTP
jgi:hypothetical protein